MIKYLKDENFNELISKGKVLVDFYAEWCGPCKMMGEILETLDVDILKVNTDEHPDLANEYKIMSIPTLILFKDGENIDRMIGLRSKSEIEEFISK